MDNRKYNGGHKTAGRKPKNSSGRHITFTPSDKTLEIYDAYLGCKAELIESAIIYYSENSNHPYLNNENSNKNRASN